MVYSPDGEMIAIYNTSGGGWQSLTTKAESQLLRDSNNIYKQAYDVARTEIGATAKKAVVNQEGTSFDVRV